MIYLRRKISYFSPIRTILITNSINFVGFSLSTCILLSSSAAHRTLFFEVIDRQKHFVMTNAKEICPHFPSLGSHTFFQSE